jgi:peroxiredoxin
VRERYEEIRQLGGEVLVISFSSPEAASAYLARRAWPFPMVFDPARTAYRAFKLGRTTLRDILRPSALVRYLKALARGWLPRKPNPGDDVLQLGGDFILDRERRLIYAHPSADPSDRPAAEELVRLVRTTVQAGARR